MTQIIVKSSEEELGSELFTVSSKTKTKDELIDCCRIAEMYAMLSWDSIEEEKPDKHWRTMAEVRDECNGIETFNYYLEHFCGCVVDDITCDFEYEW